MPDIADPRHPKTACRSYAEEMGRRKPNPQTSRGATDAAYRAALGVPPGTDLPHSLGTGAALSGAGTARNGKNRSRGKTVSWRGRTPEASITPEQVRAAICPRCLAAVGAVCRDQRGNAVSRGHAARRTLAQQAEMKRLRALRTRPQPAITRAEHKKLAVRADQIRRDRAPQRDPATNKLVFSVDGALSRF